jgi:hypothetical protein
MVEFPKIKIEDTEWYIDRTNGILISVKDPATRIELASSGDAVALLAFAEGNHLDCAVWLCNSGRPYPRTCRTCGLGSCRYGLQYDAQPPVIGPEETKVPIETELTLDELGEIELAKTFLQEALERYREVRKSSEETGQGLHGHMLDKGFVTWIDARLHDIDCELRPRATLTDCIAVAKERVLDAMTKLATAGDVKQSRERSLALAQLLALPDDEPDTLHALYVADFWCGISDSFWNTARPPRTLPPGILQQLMQAETANAD